MLTKICCELLQHSLVVMLQDVCDKGWFKGNLAALLSTAIDVATAMAFLHSRGIIHGDLSGGNVLLASSDASPHG